MLTRVVSRTASACVRARRVVRSRKVAPRVAQRWVMTSNEDLSNQPSAPKDLRGVPTSALEILTGTPAEQLTRRVYIYRPARNAMQSGNRKTGHWFLQFERSEDRWNNPVMGWVSSRDPLGQMTVKFPDRESAVRFAEQHGLDYKLEDDWLEEFEEFGRIGKNYGDKFKFKPEKPAATAALEDF